MVMHRQALYPQPLNAVFDLGSFDIEGNAASDHHIREALHIGITGVDAADIFALAKHGDTVRNTQHLMQLMGYKDYGFTVRTHCTQYLKQLFGLLRSENCSGFIQNKYIRTAVQHLDYLKGLFLGYGHLVNFLIGVHHKAVLCAYIIYARFNILQLVLHA